LRAATRDVQEELGRNGLRRDRVPHLPLRRVDTAIPGGANQQIDARGAGSRQDVIDIGFPIADADQVGRGTSVARRVDGVKTVEPLLTLFLADGQLLASGAFANIVRVPGPDLLGQEASGDPLRGNGQRGMDQQTVTRGASQRSQACGDAYIRPVGFGRILYGQNDGHGVETARGRLKTSILAGTNRSL
jgi:hypothetical protein